MISRNRVASSLAIAAIAGVTMLGVFATAAQGALRHFDGTVAAKDATAKTFQIRTQGGSKVTFRVNAAITHFERIAGGFSGLRKGMRIEVDAVKANSGLIAQKVEPQEGGGGDDNGGGGHGDGPNHH